MPFRRAQYREDLCHLPFAPPSALIGDKKETAVTKNWTSHRTAENISLKRSFVGKKKVTGVQYVVTEEFKHAAVESVRAGLDHLVNDSARGAAELSTVVEGQDLK